MKILWLLFSLLFFFIKTSLSQSACDLKEDKDGVKAYTRSREGIKFKEYKDAMNLNASLNQVRAIFIICKNEEN